MAKGYVVFNLSALHGTADLVPGRALPPNNKRMLELMIAQLFLPSLGAHEPLSATDIRSNPDDPPDVLFGLGDQQFGLELAELLPDNRLERDAIIGKIKADIMSRLPIGDLTRDWVITVTLNDDYAPRLRLKVSDSLAAALTSHFGSSPNRTPTLVAIPADLQPFIHYLRIEPWDLTDDPRIGTRDEPLIIFTAQHTNVVPDRDVPKLIESAVGRKARHDVGSLPTWLLLWSNHYAFGPFQAELAHHIDQFVQSHTLPYDRTFYLHLHYPASITEITRDP